MVTVQLPKQLRSFIKDGAAVKADGTSLLEALQNLVKTYPALGPYLFDECGGICNFINVYLNGKDVRFLETQTLTDKDQLEILLASAGG